MKSLRGYFRRSPGRWCSSTRDILAFSKFRGSISGKGINAEEIGSLGNYF